jgi:Mrp family chromosome partitioning ATPase
MHAGASDPFAESFRLLALNIHAVLADRTNKGVVVVSANPGDGRSLVAANLAMALAERQGTILHDGHARAALPVSAMFKSVVVSNGAHKNGGNPSGALPAALAEITRPAAGSRLWLTNARSPQPLESARLGEVVRTASSAGIVTVVDSPPARLSSEAFALAQEVGQVVYVVRRVAQDMDMHRQIKEQLQRLNADVVALVVNEV